MTTLEDNTAVDFSEREPTLSTVGADAEVNADELVGSSADATAAPVTHHLPFWTRVILYVVGSLFILLGIAGLFLPILQGVLFLLVGGAILSVASERVYDVLYRLFHRRPKLWSRIHRFRQRVHDKLSPSSPAADEAESEDPGPGRVDP